MQSMSTTPMRPLNRQPFNASNSWPTPLGCQPVSNGCWTQSFWCCHHDIIKRWIYDVVCWRVSPKKGTPPNRIDWSWEHSLPMINHLVMSSPKLTKWSAFKICWSPNYSGAFLIRNRWEMHFACYQSDSALLDCVLTIKKWSKLSNHHLTHWLFQSTQFGGWKKCMACYLMTQNSCFCGQVRIWVDSLM